MNESNPLIPETARYQRAVDTSWSKLGDEALILDLDSRRSHRLTGSALEIWEAILDGKSVGEIAEQIAGVYQVEKDRALADIRSMCATLAREGVLTLREGQA